MAHLRPTALVLTGLLLSSCAATAPGPDAADRPAPRPAEPEVRPNVYEVAPEQGLGGPAADTIAVLEVTGTAQVRVDPDRARVSFSVVTEDSTARGASSENARGMERVHQALGELDLPGLRIETFGYDLSPRYGRPDPQQGGVPRIEGYRATNHVRVIVDDVEAVGRIVDTAIGAGANRATGLSFEASDTEEARLEALRRAVETARTEAEAMAGALGVELGPPLRVNGGADTPGPVVRFRAEGMQAMQSPSPDTPVEAGQQTVSASVTISFRLSLPPPRE